MKLETFLPIAAPAPAGLIIGIRLYNATMNNIGAVPSEYFGPVTSLVGIVAALGCVGMIGAEITAYKQAGIALAENQKKAAGIALLAGVVCSALVVWAVSGPKSEAVISAVVISIMGYIALASRDFLARRRGVVAQATDATDKGNAFVLALEQEKTKQKRAEARAAKVPNAPNVLPNTPNKKQTFDLVLLNKVRTFLQSDPSASVRDVCAACGIKSTSTASAYMKAV